MENIKSWNDIQWSNIEKTVFRLQLRIFKASKAKEFEKVYKLQETLVNSYSAKYLSVRKVTQDNKGKRTPGVDNVVIEKAKDKFDLANRITLDGKSSPIRRTYIPKPNGELRPLGIPTIEDRAKQMLVYLALSPQWEAHFEENSFGFRPGRSTTDAIQAVWLGLKVEKWILDADISKCFDTIDHQYLLDKCNTYPKFRKQLSAWLKAGILDGEKYSFPELGTPQGGIISPLLANIALHGMRECCDQYINSLGGHRPNNRQELTFVRYADDFVIFHKDKETVLNIKKVIEEFLKPIGLRLNSTKTRLVHSRNHYDGLPPGFNFLGYHVVHHTKWNNMRLAFNKEEPVNKVDFVRIITPSKEGLERHKRKLRDTIRQYKGVNQERLIQILNPIIRGWAYSKRTQIASKAFQALDKYVYDCLWKWARKRHPKMSKIKLKQMYWHEIDGSKWVFAVKKPSKNKNDEPNYIRLQYHRRIKIVRHIKVKKDAAPFDGNFIYWAKRTGTSLVIPENKARLIRLQKGRCKICGNSFLPDDVIERDHIKPLALGGENRLYNVQAVHRYCHINKTSKELSLIRQNKRK